MKKNNKGFMLAETLLVTVFVSGVLIYLYVQFSKLNTAYDQSYLYNNVESLYALEDIKDYIESDALFTQYFVKNIESKYYIDISNCNLFTDKEYCLSLFEIENIDEIFVTTNVVPKEKINIYSDDFSTFINKINEEGEQPYRIIGSFDNSTFATIRFGDQYE